VILAWCSHAHHLALFICLLWECDLHHCHDAYSHNVFTYSCADTEMHTSELEQQSLNGHACISNGHRPEHQSAPIFSIGSVNYPRMRGGCGVLEQVGYFGHNDFNLGILLHGSCRICGGRKCCHSNMSSHAADLEGDTDEIPDEMWGWGHSTHNMKCEDFESMFHRLVNDEKDNLRLHCKTSRQIPWHPQQYTKGQRNSRVSVEKNKNKKTFSCSGGI
jgi:hypothetical protein